jgi:PilZ domain
MFFRKQKRAERRMKPDFPARLMLDGFAKPDCKIVDISESGARLAVSGTIDLPRRFSMLSHLHQGPANLFGEMGPWPASSS